MFGCSSASSSGRWDERRHNSQPGHKKDQKIFCCVTTRPGRHSAQEPEAYHFAQKAYPAERFPRIASLGVRVPLPHVPGGLLAYGVAPAGVSRLASGVPAPDIPALGSNAGSTAKPQRRGHILGAGNSAGQVAGSWSKGTDRQYAGNVPREGLLPKGPPERSDNLSGTSFAFAVPSAMFGAVQSSDS